MATESSQHPLEPIFVLPHLRRVFLEALEGLPPRHLQAVVAGETYPSREAAVIRLKDYAFSQGFVVVGEGGGAQRAKLRCCQQGKETQNNRKLTEEERKRNTKTQASDCPYKVYAANKKGKDGHYSWTIGLTCPTHNHPPLSDPFVHPQTKHRHPTYLQVVTEARRDRHRHISFRHATTIVGDDVFQLDKQGYYNLCRSAVQLTSLEAAEAVLAGLQAANFRVALRESYQLDPTTGEKTKRVIDQIWTASEEQITLARRFVSQFCYIADSTFNTNGLRLLLFSCVGISNTGMTFPICYSFIRAEAKAAFQFADQQLQQLVWREDCPPPKVVVADQGAGFIAALAEASGGRGEGRAAEQAAEIMEGAAGEGQVIREALQLCEWHVVGAIMRRLTDSKGYDKRGRGDLQHLLWEYVKSPSKEELWDRREVLLQRFKTPERTYLKENWISKERQFVRAFTHLAPNLGVNSSQRSESWHATMKTDLNGQTPLNEVCMRLGRRTHQVIKEIYREEDLSRRKSSVLLNPQVFHLLDRKVTHYALELLKKEWKVTSEWPGTIFRGRPSFLLEETGQEGEAEGPENGPPLPDVHLGPVCLLACPLPLRFSLPCRCWLFHCLRNRNPIPLSLLHPRWIIDGPPFVQQWSMSLYETVQSSDDEDPPAREPRDRGEGDAFRNDGEQLILNTSLAALEAQKELTGPEAIKFASYMKSATDVAVTKFKERAAKQLLLPPELPKALPAQKELRRDARTRKVLIGPVRAERDARKREAEEARRKKQEAEEEATRKKQAEQLAQDYDTEEEEIIRAPPRRTFKVGGVDVPASQQRSPTPPDFSLLTERFTPSPPNFSLLTEHLVSPPSFHGTPLSLRSKKDFSQASLRVASPSPTPGELPVVHESSTSSDSELSTSFDHPGSSKRLRKASRKVFSQQTRERQAAEAVEEAVSRKRKKKEEKEEAEREAKQARLEKAATRAARRSAEETVKLLKRLRKQREQLTREAEARERLVARAAKQATRIEARQAAIQKKEVEKKEKAERAEQERRVTAARRGQVPSKDVSQPQLEAIHID